MMIRFFAPLLALGLLVGTAALADPGQGHGNPHGCINPAGHERGWCKHDTENEHGYGNGTGNYTNNAQLHGVIVSVSGTRVTILQGLVTYGIDASIAINRNDTGGPLVIGRSITAYGYYDQSNYFHAQEIR